MPPTTTSTEPCSTASYRPVLITMQRHKGAYGYFHSNRFGRHDSPDQTTDEIALNPAGFSHRTPTEILSTLVHEIVLRALNAPPRGRRRW